MNDIWNPWHGCRKYSEGCENCYMFYLDRERGQSGDNIYKVKTNFDLPLKKDRAGNYKIAPGSFIRVCMTSDFFLEEADEWRDEVWNMMRIRSDVDFFLLTKRAERIKDCLPDDWGDGWDNIYLNVTVENQTCANRRIPLLFDVPSKHYGIMAAPFIGELDIQKYLAEGKISSVLADGENYEGARPLHYEWVRSLYEQCVKYNVQFTFCGTGNVFVMGGRTYHICKAYQRTEALRSGLQNPPVVGEIKVQKKCRTCRRRDTCNGCRQCGKCR